MREEGGVGGGGRGGRGGVRGEKILLSVNGLMLHCGILNYICCVLCVIERTRETCW